MQKTYAAWIVPRPTSPTYDTVPQDVNGVTKTWFCVVHHSVANILETMDIFDHHTIAFNATLPTSTNLNVSPDYLSLSAPQPALLSILPIPSARNDNSEALEISNQQEEREKRKADSKRRRLELLKVQSLYLVRPIFLSSCQQVFHGLLSPRGWVTMSHHTKSTWQYHTTTIGWCCCKQLFFLFKAVQICWFISPQNTSQFGGILTKRLHGGPFVVRYGAHRYDPLMARKCPPTNLLELASATWKRKGMCQKPSIRWSKVRDLWL